MITKKQFVINNLRRASYRWPARNEAKKKAKINRNEYVCCLCLGVYPNKDIKVDHILPVVDPVVGFVDWNTYIDRLYCDESGFQVLCNPCHDKKTEQEREVRKISKSRVMKRLTKPKRIVNIVKKGRIKKGIRK